uniref:Uncharacterized protein n=1 Tax=Proboscia inermis TaxID=420281 RepID=A0A7S0GM02_9STRA
MEQEQLRAHTHEHTHNVMDGGSSEQSDGESFFADTGRGGGGGEVNEDGSVSQKEHWNQEGGNTTNLINIENIVLYSEPFLQEIKPTGRSSKTARHNIPHTHSVPSEKNPTDDDTDDGSDTDDVFSGETDFETAARSESSSTTRVPCIDLRDVFTHEKITKIDVMKIAVKGDPLVILLYMAWDIRVDIWIIQFQTGNTTPATEFQSRALLEQNGYVKADWDVRRWCPNVLGNCMNNEIYLRDGFNPISAARALMGFGYQPKGGSSEGDRSGYEISKSGRGGYEISDTDGSGEGWDGETDGSGRRLAAAGRKRKRKRKVDRWTKDTSDEETEEEEEEEEEGEGRSLGAAERKRRRKRKVDRWTEDNSDEEISDEEEKEVSDVQEEPQEGRKLSRNLQEQEQKDLRHYLRRS